MLCRILWTTSHRYVFREFSGIFFAFFKTVTRKNFLENAIKLAVAYNIRGSFLRETHFNLHRFMWGITFNDVTVARGTAKDKRCALNTLNFHFHFLPTLVTSGAGNWF